MQRRPRTPHPALSHARGRLAAMLAEVDGPMVLAISGGSDSMFVAETARYVASHTERECVCVIVDHGMRPESEDEARLVAKRLAALGFEDVRIRPVSVGTGGGPEAAARTARYEALAKVAREVGGPVVLGHTADDQAETVLLGLARGSGARSIAGMAEVGPLPGAPDVTALRPLLELRRLALREALAGVGIRWVEDPMNEPDSPYRAADGSPLRRTAIRHEGIPGLNRALRMSVVEPLARTAQLIRRDNEALDEWADFQYEKLARPSGATVTFAIAELAPLPVAVRTRVLRRAALAAGARSGALNYWHIEHVDDLVTGAGHVRGHRSIDLPAAAEGVRLRARQDEGRLIFEMRPVR